MDQKHGLFRAMVECSTDAIILIDGTSGKIDYANTGVRRVLGYEVAALVGAHFSMLLPASDRISTQELIEHMKVHDGVFTQELRLADGDTCTMDLTATIIRWEDTDFAVLTLRDITERVRAEQERERLMQELQDALSKVRTLSGMLPICASCKRIRDDQGYWNQIESYIRTHSEAEFSHSICPACARRLYPDYPSLHGDETSS